MDDEDNEGLGIDDFDGFEDVRRRVEDRIMAAAAEHDRLNAAALHIVGMYVVGSVGAGNGQRGSDIDLVVMLEYDGETTGEYDWKAYVQNDIEPALKQNRATLAAPLPDYLGYVDPKLGDQFDCEMFIRDMTSHGDYDTIYDVLENVSMQASRF